MTDMRFGVMITSQTGQEVSYEVRNRTLKPKVLEILTHLSHLTNNSDVTDYNAIE
jgi:hypothetical protein